MFDSLTLIQGLHGVDQGDSSIASVLWDIGRLHNSFCKVIYWHVNRKFNRSAHGLARKGLYYAPQGWTLNYPNWFVQLTRQERSLFVPPGDFFFSFFYFNSYFVKRKEKKTFIFCKLNYLNLK